jgi:hypothetical protein
VCRSEHGAIVGIGDEEVKLLYLHHLLNAAPALRIFTGRDLGQCITHGGSTLFVFKRKRADG